MSKGPSPRVDQLRALREARFARNEALQKQAERAEKLPASNEPVKDAKPPASVKAPAADLAAAKSAPVNKAKRTAVKTAKKKTAKAKKSRK